MWLEKLAARVELAKAMLRLEALPRLEADLAGVRAGFEQERQGKVAETQRAAVLEARLDAANERAGKAETAAEEARADAACGEYPRYCRAGGGSC